MPPPPRPALRRRLAVLLVGVLGLLGSEVALPGDTVPTAGPVAAADTGGPAAYDRSLKSAECALLGRAFTTGLGCARARCAPGAVLWRRTPGAEACALPGQPRGYGYAATVPASECRALHRRWVAAANYCASQPSRSTPVLRDAPQCTPPYSVYVTLRERPGAYDVCVTPDQASTSTRRLAAEQRRSTPGSGVLVVGDSVTWRGSDELARLRPEFRIDGEPARRPTELAARLTAFRAGHGRPDGLVVELGTNPAPGYGRRDLAGALRTVPARTPVLLVLPYVDTGSGASPASRRFGRWARSVATHRGACVADWPAYVRAHPGLLQDGIHVRNAAEPDWARWLSAQWSRCLA